MELTAHSPINTSACEREIDRERETGINIQYVAFFGCSVLQKLQQSDSRTSNKISV